MSGGDGAPGWTYEVVGFEPEHFAGTGAAIVHATHGDPLPRMIWPTNYDKLAAATMFTLFFGGNDFALRFQIDGEPAQEFLQRHFIDAFKQVAQRVKDLPNVLGFDSFNEPSTGYIGVKDLTRHINILRTGVAPTPFESMLLGAGFSRLINLYAMSLIGPRKRGQRLINPRGVSTWQTDCECIWKQHGVHPSMARSPVGRGRRSLPGGRGRRLGPGDVLDVGDFRGVVGRPVGAEDVVEPDGRFGLVLLLPGIPWVNGLGLARHEPPVVGADVFLPEVAENGIKPAAVGAGHVLGAENRALIAPQILHALGGLLEVPIAVEADNVRGFELEPFHRAQLGLVGPVADPHPRSQRLRRADLRC